MTTPHLTTLGHGARHTNRSALAAQQKQQAERNYADAADAITVAIAELRAHGDIGRACETAGIELARFLAWRNKHPDLSTRVSDAIAFAKSDKLSYAAWEAGR